MGTPSVRSGAGLAGRVCIVHWQSKPPGPTQGTFNLRLLAATVTLPSLKSNAFGGDINIVGPLNLFPSPQGGLELLASGTLNGLNPSGITTTTVDGASKQVTAWTATSINLSDANPLGLSRSTTP